MLVGRRQFGITLERARNGFVVRTWEGAAVFTELSDAFAYITIQVDKEDAEAAAEAKSGGGPRRPRHLRPVPITPADIERSLNEFAGVDDDGWPVE